ncbi:hypothetical protein LBMAG42_35860 [Deltaproteobacteria bacterium]|nr:hypothetical protein LBMAG42_35860 [Deltaproteobacteria bacterium]
MKRLQLVELEDLPWFPAILRDGGTAFLAFGAKAAGHGKLFAPILEKAIAATGATRIVDLCSGGGGPARLVADALAEGGHRVKVLLTDLYPNPKAYAFAGEGSEGRVSGRAEPVDATAVPADLAGFRTIFNAFHHFPPDLARRILADAVAKRQPIAVFEAVSREPLMLLALLFSPLSVTLTMPLWRPFRWPWVLFTWIFPLMQPFVLWDGVVSWLRIYSVEELRELVATIDAPDWEWEIGTLKHDGPPVHATYLIGKPKAATG